MLDKARHIEKCVSVVGVFLAIEIQYIKVGYWRMIGVCLILKYIKIKCLDVGGAC